MTRKRFNFRTFTSLLLTWCFLVLLVSGAVLYVAPPGRIANWTRWQLIILTKEQWQAVHTLTAIVFLIGGLFHLLKFNWRAFLAYLRRKSGPGLQIRHEMIASVIVFGAILAGTIAQQSPFQNVMSAAESIRASWEDPSTVAPIPHMEEMTLDEFAKSLQMDPGTLTQELQALGYAAASQQEPLRQLASRYERSPVQIYTALKLRTGSTLTVDHLPVTGGGSGQGFKTLAQVAAEVGLDPEAAVRGLAGRGITAKAEERMRDIAERTGRKPYELIETLKGLQEK